ncbi:MAG TPA: response regulator transcription factor [Thermoanaerobaculia bacterium]|nr:response regulator transcription factor [Thermoanaerobaculia bacterium]
MDEPLRLLIVDSHQLFRECLAAVFTAADEGFRVEIAPGCDTAEPALARLAVRRFDVLLVGLDLPGAAGLIRQAAARWPEVRAVVLGSAEPDGEVVACLEAGARGYVLREQSLDELKAAIERVAKGETVVTPEIAHRLFGRLGELGRDSRRQRRLEFLDLTPREIEILGLIAKDLRNQEIADRLCLSVHTVKNHVHNMLEKLGLETRAEAVKYARDRGWLPRLRPAEPER